MLTFTGVKWPFIALNQLWIQRSPVRKRELPR